MNPKQIAFQYLGEENVYIYMTSFSDLNEFITKTDSMKGVWIVIYKYEKEEHYGYVSGSMYSHEQTIKCLETKSYLAPTPMNRVIYFPVPINHKADIFVKKWVWTN